jgi:hypothetical protein
LQIPWAGTSPHPIVVRLPGGGSRLVTIVAAKNVARMERSVIRVDSPARTPLPDFASLHPGYEEKKGSGTPKGAVP